MWGGAEALFASGHQLPPSPAGSKQDVWGGDQVHQCITKPLPLLVVGKMCVGGASGASVHHLAPSPAGSKKGWQQS